MLRGYPECSTGRTKICKNMKERDSLIYLIRFSKEENRKNKRLPKR